jgi:hypothetical protein
VCYNSQRQDILHEKYVSGRQFSFQSSILWSANSPPPFPCSQELPTSGLHSKPHRVHTLTDYLIFFSLLPFQPCYRPPAGIFNFGVPNMRVTCSAPPILLHTTVQPISGAEYKCWLRYTRIILVHPPAITSCFVQIFSSTPCTPTPSIFVLLLTHSAVRDRLTV